MLNREEALILRAARGILQGYKPGHDGQIEHEVGRGRVLESAENADHALFQFMNVAAHYGGDETAKDHLHNSGAILLEGKVDRPDLKAVPSDPRLRTCCPTVPGQTHALACEGPEEADER